MRAGPIVIFHVTEQQVTEVALAEHNNVVKAFPAERADQPFSLAKTTRLASSLWKLCPGRPSSAYVWAQGGAIWRQQLPKSFLIRRRRSSGFRPPTARLTHWTTLRAKKARSSSSSATIVPMLKR